MARGRARKRAEPKTRSSSQTEKISKSHPVTAKRCINQAMVVQPPARSKPRFERPKLEYLPQMSHQIYPPVAVIGNIVDGFYRYRGLRPAPRGLALDRGPAVCTSDAIVSDMERFAYMRLDALAERPRGKRDWVVILVLSESGKYSHHGPDLRELIRGVEAEQATKDGRLSELVVVAEEAFFGKKNVMDIVRERRQKARGTVSGADPGGAAPFYGAYPYSTFVHVVPDHVSVGRHTIMEEEEAKEFLTTQHLQRSSLAVLYTNEAMAVWIGAREGQHVKVCYDSQTAAKGYAYLRVELGSTDQ